jgi:hypothetical protein
MSLRTCKRAYFQHHDAVRQTGVTREGIPNAFDIRYILVLMTRLEIPENGGAARRTRAHHE